MNEVKKYSVDCGQSCARRAQGRAMCGMQEIEDPEGKYVLASGHDALAAKFAELQDERDAALAELAALKGGQKPVGRISAMGDGKQYATLDTEHMNSQALVGCELYTTPPTQANTSDEN